eukprot:3017028-Rhodomonas_salina.2
MLLRYGATVCCYRYAAMLCCSAVSCCYGMALRCAAMTLRCMLLGRCGMVLRYGTRTDLGRACLLYTSPSPRDRG